MVGAIFCSGYSLVCCRAKSQESEALRLGIAGSLANMLCETNFHVIDTINTRMKVRSGDQNAKTRANTIDFIKKIYQKEGPYGFGKGISACFYGSILSGFTYFYLYKKVKLLIHEHLGNKVKPAATYLMASVVADVFTILLCFPYDLIKCRIQSKSQIFKYRSLPHAFQDEIGKNGIRGLYKGSLPYFLTYMTFDAIMITLYESYMQYQKAYYPHYLNQTAHTLIASFLAGSIAAALTNPLECITVNMQTQ